MFDLNLSRDVLSWLSTLLFVTFSGAATWSTAWLLVFGSNSKVALFAERINFKNITLERVDATFDKVIGALNRLHSIINLLGFVLFQLLLLFVLRSLLFVNVLLKDKIDQISLFKQENDPFASNPVRDENNHKSIWIIHANTFIKQYNNNI